MTLATYGHLRIKRREDHSQVERGSRGTVRYTAEYRKRYKKPGCTETLPALLTDFEQRIPNILTAIEGSLSGLQKSMDSVSNVVSGSEQDIRALIQNSANASDELNHVAAELNSMLKKVDSIPGIIAASEELVENSAELTEKLNNHWLLGGDKNETASKH